jgi:hypothetical protein
MSSFVNMMVRWMRRCIAVTGMMIFICHNAMSQQEYFIFLQSDQQQLFYARVGEKIYSSSVAGHLVLSGLKDSTYSVFIGFPKNQHPEMEFIVPVSRKDQGFQLKDLGEQGWNLFNLLTLQLVKPRTNTPKSTAYSSDIKKKTDSYSTLMAGVVNDTAVLYATFVNTIAPEPVIKEAVSRLPENSIQPTLKTDSPFARIEDLQNSTSEKLKPKPDSLLVKTNVSRSDSAVVNNKVVESESVIGKSPEPLVRDTVIVKTETTTARAVDSTVNRKETVSVFRDSANKQPQPMIAGPALSTVAKVAEEKTDEGVRLKYVVKASAGMTDTVTLVIPYASLPADLVIKSPVEKKPDPVEKIQKPVASSSKPDSISAAGKLVMINSDCRNFASERDLDKLRIKILSEKKDSDKLEVVRKEYRTKCYTSRQIKALSELFYLDPVRFEFLSASYPFVSDSENFRQLSSLLRDPVYVEKFEGLFKN